MAGATAGTYVLGDAALGAQISVERWLTPMPDGTSEGPLSSAPTAVVGKSTSAPVGVSTITGTVRGQTLTANNSASADADGLGAFSYHWKRDGAGNRRGERR